MVSRCGSVPALHVAVAGAAAASLLLAVVLMALSSTVHAGTETGEFCPTCPDWTDLDGWLAKKDAYERSQQNGITDPQPATKTAVVEKPEPVYPDSSILTAPGASIDGWVLLDSRSPADYQKGHLPGARNLYWKDTLNGDELNLDATEEALCRDGLNRSDKILIYGDDQDAAYLFWMLSYLGHQNLSLLDGGYDAARSAGMAKETAEPIIPPSNYTIKLIPNLLVNQSNLGPLLNESTVQILDARDFSDYGLAKLTSRALPFEADKLYDNTRVKDAATLDDLLERRSLDRNSTQLVYGTPDAYALFFGLELMGYNATLLQGDWWMETDLTVSNVR
jgi:thiosulfate/3-mercaptopyruvate sulfurtransferase